MSYESECLALSPSGYWKCDEASGSLSDSSGNSHTLTKQGAGTVTYQKAGPFAGSSAVELDGASWFLKQSDSGPFSSKTLGDLGSHSIAMWVKVLDATPGAQTQLIANNKSTTGENNVNFVIETTGALNNYMWTTFGNDPTNAPAVALTNGTWVFVAMSLNNGTGAGGTRKAYINGVQVGTTQTADYRFSANTSTTNFTIGAFDFTNPAPTRHLTGEVSHVAVWNNYLLTDQNVADLYAAATAAPITSYDALIAASNPYTYLRMNEAPGAQTNLGSGTEGFTLLETEGTDSDPADPIINGNTGSVQFNEAGAAILVDATDLGSGYFATGDLTAEAWIENWVSNDTTSGSGNFQWACIDMDSIVPAFDFSLRADGKILVQVLTQWTTTGRALIQTTENYRDTVWSNSGKHHLAATYREGPVGTWTLTLFIDGVAYGTTATATANMADYRNYLTLGFGAGRAQVSHVPNENAGANVRMSNVAYYMEALDPIVIASHYDVGINGAAYSSGGGSILPMLLRRRRR